MWSLGWVLIQPDWCPYKKRKLDIQVQKGDRVRTQQEDSHLQAKERLQKKPSLPILTLDFSPPELWQNKFLMFKLPAYGTLLWQP